MKLEINPLFKFKATTIFKAFFLNALAIAVTAVAAIEIKEQTEKIQTKSTFLKVSVLFMSTFLIAFLAFSIMFILFGFGGGMLTK